MSGLMLDHLKLQNLILLQW